jgi:hypothetical protein
MSLLTIDGLDAGTATLAKQNQRHSRQALECMGRIIISYGAQTVRHYRWHSGEYPRLPATRATACLMFRQPRHLSLTK